MPVDAGNAPLGRAWWTWTALGLTVVVTGLDLPAGGFRRSWDTGSVVYLFDYLRAGRYWSVLTVLMTPLALGAVVIGTVAATGRRSLARWAFGSAIGCLVLARVLPYLEWGYLDWSDLAIDLLFPLFLPIPLAVALGLAIWRPAVRPRPPMPTPQVYGWYAAAPGAVGVGPVGAPGHPGQGVPVGAPGVHP